MDKQVDTLLQEAHSRLFMDDTIREGLRIMEWLAENGDDRCSPTTATAILLVGVFCLQRFGVTEGDLCELVKGWCRGE